MLAFRWSFTCLLICNSVLGSERQGKQYFGSMAPPLQISLPQQDLSINTSPFLKYRQPYNPYQHQQQQLSPRFLWDQFFGNKPSSQNELGALTSRVDNLYDSSIQTNSRTADNALKVADLTSTISDVQTSVNTLSNRVDAFHPTEDNGCPTGTTLVDSNCYSYANIPLPWDAAGLACQFKGGYLAVGATDVVKPAIKDAFSITAADFWVGGRSVEIDNQHWIDGTKTTLTGTADKDCLIVDTNAIGSAVCSGGEAKTYLCQYKKV